MACRPIGLCPPERLERGWSANRGARLTRVSAKRLQCAGDAVDIATTQGQNITSAQNAVGALPDSQQKAAVLDALSDRGSSRIADLGCGEGYYLDSLKRHLVSRTGVQHD